MEPPSLSTELRKLLLWLTLACFSRKFVQKQIDWTGGTDSSLKTIEMGVVSKISRATRATVLLEPPFRKSWKVVRTELLALNTRSPSLLKRQGEVR